MFCNYNKKLVDNARCLRNDMTPEERHLWYDFLKKLPLTVNRQKNIGDYIVDFYISSARIVIEIDGCQHGVPDKRECDLNRDSELAELGIKVLRYRNSDIWNHFSSVCSDILKHLNLGFDDLMK